MLLTRSRAARTRSLAHTGISICPLEEAEGGEESLKESYAGWGGGE